MRIRVPNNWTPRRYQLALWQYLEAGGTTAYEIAHRRWGKDDVALHFTAYAANVMRVGTYWHMLPKASQARKAIWKAVNPHTGKKRIDEAFPREIRASTNDTEMFIEFLNGSTWQVVGSDNYDALVGSPPVGVVLSEWALAKPQAWGYLRPILKENGGWAAFITTPRGKNHAWRMYNALKNNPDAFVEISDATQTSVFSADDLASELQAYIGEHGPQVGKALYEQEYLCSFESAIVGAIFAAEIEKARRQGRITKVNWDPAHLVYTSWDIGRSDSTAIWFYQIIGNEWHYIDYYENSGPDIMHYLAEMQAKGYNYDTLYMPHDADNANLLALQGKSIADHVRAQGFRVEIIKRAANVMNRVNAGRVHLGKCWFDEEKCAPGLDALTHYHWSFNERLDKITPIPEHDWSSHGADAFTYGAQAPNTAKRPKKPKAEVDSRGYV